MKSAAKHTTTGRSDPRIAIEESFSKRNESIAPTNGLAPFGAREQHVLWMSKENDFAYG